jgi:hypothetical protein
VSLASYSNHFAWSLKLPSGIETDSLEDAAAEAVSKSSAKLYKKSLGKPKLKAHWAFQDKLISSLQTSGLSIKVKRGKKCIWTDRSAHFSPPVELETNCENIVAGYLEMIMDFEEKQNSSVK